MKLPDEVAEVLVRMAAEQNVPQVRIVSDALLNLHDHCEILDSGKRIQTSVEGSGRMVDVRVRRHVV